MGLAGGYVARQLVRQATFLLEMLDPSAWLIRRQRTTSPDHDGYIMYRVIL